MEQKPEDNYILTTCPRPSDDCKVMCSWNYTKGWTHEMATNVTVFHYFIYLFIFIYALFYHIECNGPFFTHLHPHGGMGRLFELQELQLRQRFDRKNKFPGTISQRELEFRIKSAHSSSVESGLNFHCIFSLCDGQLERMIKTIEIAS